MPGPITDGKDFNLFGKYIISNTSFTSEATVVINFKGQTGLYLLNTGLTTIEYSFNGTTVHGDLTPAAQNVGIMFPNRRVSRIWFRVPSGSSTVRVEAWGAI